jgi:Ca2+/Na+ antiporter
MKEQKLITALFFLAMLLGVLAPFVYYAQYSGIVQLGFLAFTALVAVFLVYSYGFHTHAEEEETEEMDSAEEDRYKKIAIRAVHGFTLSQNILKNEILDALRAIYGVKDNRELAPYIQKENLEFLLHQPKKARMRKSGMAFYNQTMRILRTERVL